MSDDYVWLLAHMGRVERKAKSWDPYVHPPLLKYLHQYIQLEMNAERGTDWFARQKAVLK